MSSVNEILELSPPVALALGLVLLGAFLKRSPFPNWAIPLGLCAIGAAVFPFIADVGKVSFQVRNPVVFHALLGGIIGLASTGLHAQFQNIIDRFLPANGESKERTNEKANDGVGSGGGG